MNNYLFMLFTEHPRRYRVIENTIRNKRTQATLFWALNYQILNWLGSADHMTRNEFDAWMHHQQEQGLLMVQDDCAWLTKSGVHHKQRILKNYYQPRFDRWTWLVNTKKYSERFLLAIQAISELSFYNRNYVPLGISITEMSVVRNWLTRPGLISTVHKELLSIGEYLSSTYNQLAVLFAHTLLGHEMSGWTDTQAANELEVTSEEVIIMRRDIWLGIASYLAGHPQSNLGQLMNSLLNSTPISNSAWRTVSEFQRGVPIPKIAHVRHLKISTVREHLLEAAIIIPQSIDWQRLLTANKIKAVQSHHRGPVSEWQFTRSTNQPADDFFYFRLVQIWELHHQHE